MVPGVADVMDRRRVLVEADRVGPGSYRPTARGGLPPAKTCPAAVGSSIRNCSTAPCTGTSRYPVGDAGSLTRLLHPASRSTCRVLAPCTCRRPDSRAAFSSGLRCAACSSSTGRPSGCWTACTSVSVRPGVIIQWPPVRARSTRTWASRPAGPRARPRRRACRRPAPTAPAELPGSTPRHRAAAGPPPRRRTTPSPAVVVALGSETVSARNAASQDGRGIPVAGSSAAGSRAGSSAAASAATSRNAGTAGHALWSNGTRTTRSTGNRGSTARSTNVRGNGAGTSGPVAVAMDSVRGGTPGRSRSATPRASGSGSHGGTSCSCGATGASPPASWAPSRAAISANVAASPRSLLVAGSSRMPWRCSSAPCTLVRGGARCRSTGVAETAPSREGSVFALRRTTRCSVSPADARGSSLRRTTAGAGTGSKRR